MPDTTLAAWHNQGTTYLTVLKTIFSTDTYLNSLCDNSEEETPDNNLAHMLETVCDRGLDAVLHDLAD